VRTQDSRLTTASNRTRVQPLQKSDPETHRLPVILNINPDRWIQKHRIEPENTKEVHPKAFQQPFSQLRSERFGCPSAYFSENRNNVRMLILAYQQDPLPARSIESSLEEADEREG